MDGFRLHFQEMSAMGPGTSDYSKCWGDPYTPSLVTTLAVCLGRGLRSPTAFLVILMFNPEVSNKNGYNTVSKYSSYILTAYMG